VAIHYITWQDAQAHLDREVHTAGQIDIARLQRLCEDAADKFDNELRLRFEVPFVQATSPEAYKIAQNVCARWAAAAYIEWAEQAQGTKDQVWYFDRLKADAQEFMDQLTSRRAPDAEVNASGLVYVPDDGVEVAGEEPVVHRALFKRDRLPGGTNPW
jgi:phage gp36-like protein